MRGLDPRIHRKDSLHSKWWIAGSSPAMTVWIDQPQSRTVSHRHPHGGAQAAHRAVAERDVAAVRAGDVAGDRQAQSGAAFILVAGVVEPQERLEHLFAHFRWDARPVVVDRDRQI